ncbi:PREDICTED: mitochondrial ribosome-associated GTPase 2 [Papilio xuthus]|uniref:Mitochondrial ribosome-associated GTPase 2 n=1 Tax=Papilio xuthus TaxID=66420 RepID=A0AAJ6Z1T6_PAPXU|nr:PREDICTED: mitochondrial ribosome-associated GTPase 2 [Papilio xuthus]
MRLINLLKNLRITYTQTIRTYSDYTPKPLRSLKPKSNRQYVQYYVDSCRVRAVGGNGGDGCISFLSAWCKEHAGPDGGDGGHGGHVIFQASHTVKSLNHCRSVVQAKHGGRGDNKDCTGKNAQHVVIPVPLGTIVKDAQGRVLGDLEAEGTMFVAARGGAGGRGNKFFLTATQQAPDIAELGAVGETCVYTLEVRSMAHVGLVGFPNAGKSTLLRAVTRARPTVAPYPFTTKQPHIGMVLYDDYEQIAIADLPGLIPGSHKNYGLGIQFLQHLERCRGLIYLLDGASDALQQLLTLEHEVQQYSAELATRPSLLVLNKTDLETGERAYEDLKTKRPETVLGISAKTGHNVSELLKAIRNLYDNNL